VYICSKTPREGGQLTRVAHAKKGPQYAPCKPPDRCRHRRINFSPILTEIDLTSDEPDENGKKKRFVKTSYRFTDGLCRKCRQAVSERLQPPASHAMKHVMSSIRRSGSYLMVCGRTRFCRNSLEIVQMMSRSQNEETAVLQLWASPLEAPYIYLICCDTEEFKCD